jgi:hypothetical protein
MECNNMDMDVVYDEWAKTHIIEPDNGELLDLSPIKLSTATPTPVPVLSSSSMDERLTSLENKMMDRLDDLKTTLTTRFDANDARQGSPQSR